MKLKCFIASAFDRDDVDVVYDDVIQPLLRKVGVSPLRVNRKEHNDDIDDKIFELLDESHLCIADLTYARPSVYYEAGYARASGKPVIHIAHRDHSKQRDEDEFGNFRIHFDLLMKNIIWWPNPRFEKQLQSRLNLVLRPLQKMQDADDKKRQAEAEFAKKSHVKQVATLLDKGTSLMQYRQFRQGDGLDRLAYYMLGYSRKDGGVYQQVCHTVQTSLRKGDLEALMRFFVEQPSDEKERAQISRYEHYLVFTSLRPVSHATLTELLHRYDQLVPGVYSATSSSRPAETPTENRIVVVAPVKSVDDFTAKFKEQLDKCGLVKPSVK